MIKIAPLLAITIIYLLIPGCKPAPEKSKFQVNIEVDITSDLGEIKPVWRFFGADEPNYAYMKNGRKLLGDLGKMKPKEVYFRAHNLLNTGKGTYDLKWGSTNAYTEDENGNPVYDWTLVDSIFDAYLENDVRPYAQIGFMPEALSTKPNPYRHFWNPKLPYDEVFTGWAYPPNNYKKWEELVYQWVSHCIDRYGKEEVEAWYWQTWNEPNIPYWQGTVEEFHKLHDYAINGVLRALPTARVGGPDAAGHGGDFSRAFIEHCLGGTNYATGEYGTKLDFFSFHAKGAPTYDSGFVQMNMGRQLRTINEGFKLVSSYPQIADIPIVIGESDPEGCAACQGDQLGYRNGTMYSSYTAAIFPRKLDLALKHGVNLEGALTWAFEFEDQPYFAGFRSLATNGINKPVLNVFRMFSKMKGKRLAVESDSAIPLDSIVSNSVRSQVDVQGYASFDGEKVYILYWHYHDSDIAGPSAEISMAIKGLPADRNSASVNVYLVDQTHSNAYTVWKEMGSPQEPNEAQYQKLEEASELEQVISDQSISITSGKAVINTDLERQGVGLIVIKLY
ncbi:MAG: beta-xylosidase [Bacteroidota bacterium]